MIARTLSLRLLGVAAVVLLSACVTRPPPLYMWERFPRQQYDALLRTDAVVDEQIRALEAHAEKARGANAVLPPGLRAHLGMLYLSVGNASQARGLWVAEKEAFPEAAPYMNQLLKRLDGQPAQATQEPAK